MIRTVLGDIDKNEISGNILTHEHIMCVSGEMMFTRGNKWLDLDKFEDYATTVVSEVKKRFGASLIIDGTPCDLGRDVGLIRRVAEHSGVHIVASSGLYYFPSALTFSRSADELAAIFIGEAENGVGEERIPIGCLKCAVDSDGFTRDTEKRVRAVAIVQRETGLPVYAHCRFTENTAHELLNIFEAEGADISRVNLGHATSRLDSNYLASLLERGCYLGFDQCFAGGEKRCASVVAELCRRGFTDKLIFSLDRPIYNEFERASRTGIETSHEAHISRYGFLFTDMLPAFLAAGCTAEDCRKFTAENPLGFLDLIKGTSNNSRLTP